MRIAPLAILLAACTPAVKTSSTPATPVPTGIASTESNTTIQLNEAPPAASTVIDAPLDSVWLVLPAVYTKMELAADASDKASGLYGVRTHTSSRVAGKRTMDLLRCPNTGSGSAAGTYRTRMSVMTTLAPLPDRKTALSTEVTGFATSVEGTSTGALKCVSTGEIEKGLARLVRETLETLRTRD